MYGVELVGGPEDGHIMAFSDRPPPLINLPFLVEPNWMPVSEGKIAEVQTNYHIYQYVRRKYDGTYMYRYKGVG